MINIDISEYNKIGFAYILQKCKIDCYTFCQKMWYNIKYQMDL